MTRQVTSIGRMSPGLGGGTAAVADTKFDSRSGDRGQDLIGSGPLGTESLGAEHEASKREVDMYIRTYQTLLRSSGEVGLKALIQAHYNIDSILHPDARSSNPDMSAFIYAVLRLP